jgi:carboxylesterase type B
LIANFDFWVLMMKEKLLIQLFIFLCSYAIIAAEQPTVKLPEYTVLGFEHFSKNAFKANIFLGLPYAKAPVGDLRFEKPQSLSHIPDKIVNATVFSPACHQIENMAHMGIESSEDCLYLNIIAPSEKSDELYPVLVFIHGGGFSYGFTKIYGYETYVNNIVSQKVIMVTLQYRLAHFGFLATEDFEVAGNFANFDQIMALKFLQQNIKAFGGDPKRITVCGHSAGSLSVHTLSISPKAKNLFSQQIQMAASNNAEWAISNTVFKHSELISKAVGCSQSNTKERKACLKTVRYDEFWKVRKDLNLLRFSNDYNFLYWTSVYDNDLFEGKKLEELLPQMPVNNILYGIDAGEGLLFTLNTGHPVTSVFALTRGFTPENRGTASAETVKSYLHQLLTYEGFTPDIKDSIINEIFEFYQIDDNYMATNPLHYFEKYTEMLTDTLMSIPAGKEITGKLQHGFNKQYIYIFNYTRPEDRQMMGSYNPPHGYEHLYLSGLHAYTLDFDGILSEEEIILQKHLCELFVTFVKTGKPSAAGISVPSITNNDYPYMEFNPNVSVKRGFFEPRMQFWETLMKKYGYDFILGEPIKKTNDKNEL